MKVLVLPRHTVTFSACNVSATTSLSAQCKQFFEIQLLGNKKWGTSVHRRRKGQLSSSSNRLRNLLAKFSHYCLSLATLGLAGTDAEIWFAARTIRQLLSVNYGFHLQEEFHLSPHRLLQQLRHERKASRPRSIACETSFFTFSY